MYYICCAGIGYCLGSISPSYIIGKIKNIDMRQSGTKNLGASNAFMHFGRFWGAFVMFFDILKAFLAIKISNLIFSELAFAGLVAGSFSVIGHNYPFYIKFKGGKGLASYAGLVLGTSPMLFIILLTCCLAISFVFNYGCVIALSATVLFPILAGIKFGSIAAFAITAICSASVFLKHMENIKRIRSGEETKLTSFVGKYILKITSRK